MTIYVNSLLSAAAADVTGKPTPTRTWQWLRNGTAISGANSSTYTVVEADLAANLSVSQIETNLGGIDTATSTALGPVSTFGVNSLFANDEEGAWYDPSDLSTLFQDIAGTTPVTAAGQPVGLLLDKSQGLVIGPELIADTGFDDPSFWNDTAPSVVVSGGEATFTSSPSAARVSSTLLPSLTLGTFYQATLEISSISEGSLRIASAFGTNGPDFATAGVFTFYLIGDGSAWRPRSVGTTTAVLTRFSVKELPGNHATQATSAARPTYQTSAGLHWLAFDGVDDAMVSPVDRFGVFDYAMSFDPDGGDFILFHARPSTFGGWVGIGQSTVGSSKTDLDGVEGTQLSLYVDGVLSTATTRGGQHTLIQSGNVAVANYNTTGALAEGWGATIGFYASGLNVPGPYYGSVVREGTMTTDQRNNLTTYLGSKSGVTL